VLVRFLVSAAIYALVLSVVPWVKHKGYGACFAVAIIMAGVRIPLLMFAFPLLLSLVFFSTIPFIGWILGSLAVILLTWSIHTIALYLADQAIEDFEIKSFGDTALTALVTGLFSFVLLRFLHL